MSATVKGYAKYLAAASAVLAMAALLAVALAPRRAAELALATALPGPVRDELRYEVESADWRSLRLANVAMRSAPLAARAVEISWNWNDLRAGRVDRVAIDALSLAAWPGGPDGSGAQIEGFDELQAMFAPDGDAGAERARST